MKVKINGVEMSAVRYQLEEEGEEIVTTGEELLLTDILTKTKGMVIGGNYIFPDLVVKAMGFEVVKENTEIVVMRWFDRQWHPQVLIGFPLLKSANGDLGAPCEAGIACRYIHASPLVELFNSSALVDTLLGLRYVGLVSICTTLNGEVTQVRTGAPCYGMYNVLEGVKGRTVEFFTGESPALMESWTVGIVISRFPWPFLTRLEPVAIKGITPTIKKHLWLLETSSYKHTAMAEGMLIGVATAWSQTLSEAARRTLRTLEAIEVPEAQYRTDVVNSVGSRVRDLTLKGWLS